MPVARLVNRLRERRRERGWSQIALARRAGVARQTVSGIEGGLYGPGLDVALRLARALSCRVEDIFDLGDDPSMAEGIETPASSLERVAVAEIGGRTVIRPLRRTGAVPWSAGYGMADFTGNGPHHVRRYPGTAPAIFLAGCDPALGLLAAHLGRTARRLEGFWWPAGNRFALEQLGRRDVHAAAIHHPLGSADPLPPLPVRRFRLGGRQMGWIVRAGNPKHIFGADDLIRSDVRIVNRESGSGARALLDGLLAKVAMPSEKVLGYEVEASGHFEVAQAVALGAADVGIGVKSAADEAGCAFLPLLEEVCDLWVAREEEDDHAVSALLNTLRSGVFRGELAAFGDYDTSRSGDELT